LPEVWHSGYRRSVEPPIIYETSSPRPFCDDKLRRHFIAKSGGSGAGDTDIAKYLERQFRRMENKA
jgi:hypothetical protein